MDTTANTLIWLLYHLAKFPKVQEKAFQEISEVCQGGDYQAGMLEKLPYMKLVFKDSYRLNPLGGGVLRILGNEVTLMDGYVLPKKTSLLLNPVPLYRHKDYVENPNELVPERWTDEEKEKRKDTPASLIDHPFFILPFSFGYFFLFFSFLFLFLFLFLFFF